MAATSLLVLDARAAYISILVAAAIVIAVRDDRTKICRMIRELVPSRLAVAVALISLMFALALGYSAGESRWHSIGYSVEAAVADVIFNREQLADRPYVDLAYWNTDIADLEECRRSRQTRCLADQSAYLRLAWTLEGLESLIVHPLGIGYSADYMGRYWDVAGDPTKYQRQDSFLTLLAVFYGWPGVLSIVWIITRLVGKVRTLSLGSENAGEFAIIFMAITIIARMMYDQVTGGLWCYLLAIIGSASMPLTLRPSLNGTIKGQP